MTHYADINIMVRVNFTDNGETDLATQATDAVLTQIVLGELEDFGMEIVGKIEMASA